MMYKSEFMEPIQDEKRLESDKRHYAALIGEAIGRDFNFEVYKKGFRGEDVYKLEIVAFPAKN